MTGPRILLALLLLTGGVVAYVLMPSDVALERRDAKLDSHRTGTTEALGECTELVQFFDRLKPSEKKKKELGALRRRQEGIDAEARTLVDGGEDSADALRAFEDLELSYWELLRDAQDLRARLREMKRYKLELDPLTARNGRLQRELQQLGQVSVSPEFTQQAGHLMDQSRVARRLAADGMVALSDSIVTGQPLCEAARRQLQSLIKDMEELIAEEKKARGAGDEAASGEGRGQDGESDRPR